MAMRAASRRKPGSKKDRKRVLRVMKEISNSVGIRIHGGKQIVEGVVTWHLQEFASSFAHPKPDGFPLALGKAGHSSPDALHITRTDEQFKGNEAKSDSLLARISALAHLSGWIHGLSVFIFSALQYSVFQTTPMTQRKGIILAGGTGSRLHPLTLASSKQLMPVYDKPMIYYPISVLMLAGIREILIISTPHDLPSFKQLLGDGSQFGVRFEYEMQPSPDGLAQAFLIGETFLAESPAALVLGDNLFYGQDFTKFLRAANDQVEGATIFGYEVANPTEYGVVEFDGEGNVLSLEEKPTRPKSRYAVPGLYFYDTTVVDRAKKLKPSSRGELEITDLNRAYAEDKALKVLLLGRGFAWLDTGTHDSLHEAGDFVRAIQRRQGLQIGCLEEVALHQGWIDAERLAASVKKMGKSTYAIYLKELLVRE
jgi:glucose-1-phosphate thymidylyltransferase